MQKLNKSEFMSKVINDLYNKQRKEKEKQNSARIHSIVNVNRIKEYGRKHK